MHLDEQPLEDHVPRARRDAAGRTARRPSRSNARRRRYAPAWGVLALAVAALTAGVVLPHGLLLGAGLVLAGLAGHLFDPWRAPARRRTRRP